MKKDSKNKKTKTIIYLLTDGAVNDTGAIIDLVKANCGPDSNTRINTFGIG